MMTVKEQIHAELEGLSPEALQEILQAVRERAATDMFQAKGFLTRLQEIRIDAPEDFSVNWERYASGELPLDPNVS